MKVYIQNLYGIKDGRKAYYRKDGDCFDFVNSPVYATNLTREEAEHILSFADFYKKQFNADTMGIEV